MKIVTYKGWLVGVFEILPSITYFPKRNKGEFYLTLSWLAWYISIELINKNHERQNSNNSFRGI